MEKIDRKIILMAEGAIAITVCLGAFSLTGKNVINYYNFTPPCKLKQVTNSEPLQQLAQSITVRIFSKNSGASGTLIAKQGQIYTVLTSQRALTPGAPYRIQTPDGYTYPAVVVKKVDFGGNDVALLQFFGFGDQYAVASPATLSHLAVNDEVFAAGYSSDTNGFVFTNGKISLLADKALKGGYRIGYTNEMQQGMIGGPILNRQGELIGLNGVYAYPLFGNPYVFEDSSQPNATQQQQMTVLNWSVPIQTVLQKVPQLKENNLVQHVEQVAKEITLPIVSLGGNGSGVIIAQQGNTYYVLTASHVVQDNTEYEMTTPDGRCYLVNYNTIKRLEGVDLAVLTFKSDRTYRVAELGQYDLSKIAEPVFVSGWAATKQGNQQQPNYLLTAGLLFNPESASLQAKDSSSLTKGYKLVYTNITAGGVSGGPVLDLGGRVIGIHGRADGESTIDEVGHQRRMQLGYSLGIPISAFLSLVPQLKADSDLKLETTAAPPLTQEETNEICNYLVPTESPLLESADAIDWLNYGNQLWRLFRLEEATQAFDKAIQLKPNFSQAWYAKGLTQKLQKKYPDAIASFDRAIAFFDQTTQREENLAIAWRERGKALFNLKQYSEALASYDRAIALYPQEFVLYQLRGNAWRELKQYEKAIAAYSEAIRLKPDYAEAYLNRGVSLELSGNYRAAISDYTEAIRIKPDLPQAYANRGVSYSLIAEQQGAIADLQKAAELSLQQKDKATYQLTQDRLKTMQPQ